MNIEMLRSMIQTGARLILACALTAFCGTIWIKGGTVPDALMVLTSTAYGFWFGQKMATEK
jgi:hypothetical protein